ncbi:MAG: hypothetical protein QXQ37_00710 [Nitrososphaerota archaeon]
MKYATLREIRLYLGFLPIKVTGESLGVGDNSTKVFYTKNKAIVDFDFDNQILDDVVVYINGSPANIDNVDAERGIITLANAPASGASVTADYYYHPIADSELISAVEQAEAEIDAICGQSFDIKQYSELHEVTTGDIIATFRTPIASIDAIRLETYDGKVIKTLSSDEYQVLDERNGIIRLRHYAGLSSPPWYFPTTLYVRIIYNAGYSSIPVIVNEATKRLAAYIVMQKIVSMSAVAPEYQNKINLVFSRPEDLKIKLDEMRQEAFRIIKLLPKQVRKI